MWAAVFLLAVAVTAFADPAQVAVPKGLRAPNSRVIGGWVAEEGQFPYQLGLRLAGRSGGVIACGGTIIHSQWGLTAAHCTANRVSITVRAGSSNLTSSPLVFENKAYHTHFLYSEAFSQFVQPHDISLLEFGRTITFTDNIRPIRLQRARDMDRNYAGRQAIATGWGRTSDSPSTEVLNWVYLSPLAHFQCLMAYWGNFFITPSTLCTVGYNQTTQSVCEGDSGGPLIVVDDDGQLTQIGVSSFVSQQGCQAGIPAGFIRTGHYVYWMLDITGILFDW